MVFIAPLCQVSEVVCSLLLVVVSVGRVSYESNEFAVDDTFLVVAGW